MTRAELQESIAMAIGLLALDAAAGMPGSSHLERLIVAARAHLETLPPDAAEPEAQP